MSLDIDSLLIVDWVIPRGDKQAGRNGNNIDIAFHENANHILKNELKVDQTMTRPRLT